MKRHKAMETHNDVAPMMYVCDYPQLPLPQPILHMIASYLVPADFCSCSLISRAWCHFTWFYCRKSVALTNAGHATVKHSQHGRLFDTIASFPAAKTSLSVVGTAFMVSALTANAHICTNLSRLTIETTCPSSLDSLRLLTALTSLTYRNTTVTRWMFTGLKDNHALTHLAVLCPNRGFDTKLWALSCLSQLRSLEFDINHQSSHTKFSFPPELSCLESLSCSWLDLW
jgi:hypothetical protein